MLKLNQPADILTIYKHINRQTKKKDNTITQITNL